MFKSFEILFRRWPALARASVRQAVCIFPVFFLLASAAGQTVGGNAGTNQPATQIVPTNAAPVENVETPSLPPPVIEQLQEQSPLTNSFGVTPGQPVPLGPASAGQAQPAAPIMGTSAIAGPPASAPVALGPGILLWGPITLHPGLLYSYTTGNGIEAQAGQQSRTAVNKIAPRLLFELGMNWSLDYNPTLSYYSNPQFKNNMDQSVSLHGNWSNEDWSFGVSQTYVSSTQPLVETGTQTAQEAYVTSLNASHQMSGKLSLQLGLDQSFRNAQGLTDSKQWTGDGWLNYQAMKSFGAGIGVTLGYAKVDPGSDMPTEQLQGRINFNPGPRLSLTVSGGAEDRQFIGPSAPSSISPVFNGMLQYQIFQATSVNLNASESVTPSLYANQIETITTYGLSVHQRLSGKISVDANVGYTTEPLTSIVPSTNLPPFFFGTPPKTALAEVRDDTIYSYRMSVSYAMLRRLSFSAFYSITDNASGQTSFAYWSHQVGLSLNYQY
jgi:hypothetical protein